MGWWLAEPEPLPPSGVPVPKLERVGPWRGVGRAVAPAPRREPPPVPAPRTEPLSSCSHITDRVSTSGPAGMEHVKGSQLTQTVLF